MIITLAKANFSTNNIGTLNHFAVLTNLGAGLVYDGPSMSEKNSALVATITAQQGNIIVADEVVITIGGVAVTNGVTITNSKIEINIPSVTGAIFISVGAKRHNINAGLELILGFANGSKISDNNLPNRVRTKKIYGNYKLTVNPDYRIRMVVTDLDDSETNGVGTIYSNTSTTLTEITVTNPDKYSIITFAHADASKNISPTDDIVATYEPYNWTWVEGNEITTSLTQGHALATGQTPGLNNTNTTRVRTGVIQGPFAIECEDGFVVRGVSTSTSPDGYSGGKDIVGNAALKSYRCADECLGYSIVTFADATNPTATISPTSNIIKRLVALEQIIE